MDFFNTPVHAWFALNKRDLPWRNTTDPYKIWLSEIILQQTRIDQGLSYYHRFVGEFPTIIDLANASEDKVLKCWQGLGYYSRARNLHATAKLVSEKYSGIFPSEYKDILALKGIGEYTAAAIASISFGLEYPTIDGNVFRVLSRFFGIDDPIDSKEGKKTFSVLAKELIKGTDPAMHNQAVMEFGALQCKPKNPDCSICPISNKCFALANAKINSLPAKQNKTKQRDRYFSYILLEDPNYIYLRKRHGNDIWKNLYELPFIERANQTEIDDILHSADFEKDISSDTLASVNSISKWKIHILSHQRIHFRFIEVKLAGDFKYAANIIKVSKEDIFNFAVPRLLETFLDEYLKNA
jgi:A/G-specific adenine glycosylase